MMCFSSFIGTIVGPVKEELNGHYFFFFFFYTKTAGPLQTCRWEERCLSLSSELQKRVASNSVIRDKSTLTQAGNFLALIWETSAFPHLAVLHVERSEVISISALLGAIVMSFS